MNLGQFIRQQRLKKGYTMDQLAKLIGKNKAYISRIENNKVRTLKKDSIEPLAKALGIPVIALFDGFDTNGNRIKSKEITSKEFANQVKTLLSQTNDLSEQQKQHLLNTLEFICSDKE